MRALYADVDILQYKELSLGTEQPLRLCLVYFDGVVDAKTIDAHILRPLLALGEAAAPFPRVAELPHFLINRVLQINGTKRVSALAQVLDALPYGDTLLLADGVAEGLLLDTKKFVTRSIQEPDGEKILSGPREGFSEALMQNLSLLLRRLRTNDLKLKVLSMGEKSNTQICLAYLGSLVKPGILEELNRRLQRIDLDAVLDSNYITELIRDNPLSIFRTIGYTERPDVVAGKILEGRIAILVDGTPVALTVPYLFVENFQSSEDYYLSAYYASFARLLRILGFFLAVTIPALYVAIVTFHHEMLPTPLMINIAVDSHNVPLPAGLEAFLLLLMFDILRETGIRMPLGLGQALSVVGALVVGSAAVEADLVSAPMIIVCAISGITSLLIPKMNAPILFYRMAFLLIASILGFYGLTLGLAMLLVHVLGLESFGILQLTQDLPLRVQRIKDTAIRLPWGKMIDRPEALTDSLVRQRREGGKEP